MADAARRGGRGCGSGDACCARSVRRDEDGLHRNGGEVLMEIHPLSGCAASPSLASREGNDTFAARRLLLGVTELDRARSGGKAWRVSATGN